jgi:hypothetical protein
MLKHMRSEPRLSVPTMASFIETFWMVHSPKRFPFLFFSLVFFSFHPFCKPTPSLFNQIEHHGYFVSSKQREYVNSIQSIILPYFLGMNDNELRAVKKEDYETLMKWLTKLFESVTKKNKQNEKRKKKKIWFSLPTPFSSPIRLSQAPNRPKFWRDSNWTLL